MLLLSLFLFSCFSVLSFLLFYDFMYRVCFSFINYIFFLHAIIKCFLLRSFCMLFFGLTMHLLWCKNHKLHFTLILQCFHHAEKTFTLPCIIVSVWVHLVLLRPPMHNTFIHILVFLSLFLLFLSQACGIFAQQNTEHHGLHTKSFKFLLSTPK